MISKNNRILLEIKLLEKELKEVKDNFASFMELYEEEIDDSKVDFENTVSSLNKKIKMLKNG